MCVCACVFFTLHCYYYCAAFFIPIYIQHLGHPVYVVLSADSSSSAVPSVQACVCVFFTSNMDARLSFESFCNPYRYDTR